MLIAISFVTARTIGCLSPRGQYRISTLLRASLSARLQLDDATFTFFNAVLGNLTHIINGVGSHVLFSSCTAHKLFSWWSTGSRMTTGTSYQSADCQEPLLFCLGGGHQPSEHSASQQQCFGGRRLEVASTLLNLGR